MSRKLPTDLKPKQVIKALKRLGFSPYRQRGSHLRLKHSDGRWTQVAVHTRPIPPGTLNKILRQTELDLEELLKNL